MDWDKKQEDIKDADVKNLEKLSKIERVFSYKRL